jgi:hypothetical protein
VEAAVRPRPEIVLGGETRLLDVAFSVARPVAEAVLLGIDRWYRLGDEPAARPGSLWQRPEQPQLSGGIPSRDSLLAPLQLGRRLLPDRRTPVTLVRHLGLATRRAAGLAARLTSPVPEVEPPVHGLRGAGGPAQAHEQATV